MDTQNNHTVLVIDDDPDIRETLSAALQIYGYQAEDVGDGLEALEWLRTHHVRPCVMFLDLMMPKLNGFEFRAAQLKEPELAKIPVVIITGAPAMSRDPSLAGLSVLTKPFDLNAILSCVQQLCRVHRG
jgi:CheY-like chemotaxis protein